MLRTLFNLKTLGRNGSARPIQASIQSTSPLRGRRSATPFLATTLLVGVSALGLFAAVGQEAPQDAKKVEELSADHSLASVVDREGVATFRPAASERWSCADAHDRLFVGDWLQTGARGANALSVKFKSGGTLILGPGAQVELVDATHVAVNRGEVEIGASEKAPIAVSGPGGASFDVTGRKVVRASSAKGQKLETLDAEPKWLAGYKSGQSTEALGSLLATVDGRDVPLTLGYHTVHVDVRDQIARTVVEESFLNHTSHVLEGVFYFPLPADASISSFGMWIGDELVEGDIVEKERARAIYEQILREKRDPGLLEWSGGNVFKARVYPISGEKRIKLAYTQVLPKTGDTWSYHYALQSEMLRLHPLSKLAIDVKISSAEPIIAVASPSHACRTRMTEHAASVEFEAAEYTPDRDFELRVATRVPTNGSADGLTFVSDLRGDDGYFLARFRAPAADAATRAAVEKQPLDLVILADTSGSMAGVARATQIQFVEALLASLGEKDTFQLATCDVETRLAFVQPMANTAENREAALRFLEERDALGWSDLATGLKTVLTSARKQTQVVYVGDAIPTLGDADPGAFANRVPTFYEGRGSVHVVVPGNTSEPLVVRALSRLGGGSSRSIGGGTDATQTASELLAELAAPSARDLKLTIDGIAAAAVYPEDLPNLCEGREQVIVGRYDPLGGRKGKLKVRGLFDGKPVESSAQVTVMAKGDVGANQSFIPRLWARSHLDHLMTQGASPQNKARIVALSEDFQIATQYTSFLVLESEADRERFAVQKRMRMRDGEEFFAKGRSDATFELVRQQMQKATLWHRGVRADLIKALVLMERGLTETLRTTNAYPMGAEEVRGALGVQTRSGMDLFSALGGGGGGKPGSRGKRQGGYDGPAAGGERMKQLGYVDGDMGDNAGLPASEIDSLDDSNLKDEESQEQLPEESEAEPALALEKKADDSRSRREAPAAAKAPATLARGRMNRLAEGSFEGDDATIGFLSDEKLKRRDYHDDGRRPRFDTLDALFPGIADPTAPGEIPATWPDEVKALLRALDRRPLLATTALHIATSGTTTDRRSRTSAAAAGDWLLAKDSWRTVAPHLRGDGFVVEWLRGGKRGAWRADWLLGRVRDEKPLDATSVGLPIAWTTAGEFASMKDYAATAKELGNDQVEVTFVHPNWPKNRFGLTIDRKKAVVLATRWMAEEPRGETLFGDFVAVAGAFFPTTITTLDEKGRVASVQRLAIDPLTPAECAARIDGELTTRPQLVELGPAPKDLDTAKQHAAKNEATLEDLWLLLTAAAARGEADEAQARFVPFNARVEGRFGVTRITLALLSIGRRHEELRQALLAQAKLFVGKARDPELALAGDLLGLAAPLGAGQEMLELLRALEPIYRRHADRRESLLQFEQQVIGHTAAMQRPDETAALQEQAAHDWPDVVGVQTTWADVLAGRGELDQALAWLDRVQKENGPWSDGEIEQLESDRQNLLWNGYRLDALVALIEARLRESADAVNPTGLDMYMSALVMLDREGPWTATLQRWLDEGKVEKPSQGARRRVEVAIRQALGQGYAFYWWNRRFTIDESNVLAGAARAYLAHDASYAWAHQILTHQFFRTTPQARALIAEVFAGIEKGVESMTAQQLAAAIQLVRGAAYEDPTAPDRWLKIDQRILARWMVTTVPVDQMVLENLLASANRHDLLLELWRTKLARATNAAEQRAAALQLFALRLSGEWGDAAQGECLAMLTVIAKPHEGTTPADDELRKLELRQTILAWYDFVNWAVEQRVAHDLAAQPDVNNLPRRKLAALRDELKKTARLSVRELLVARVNGERAAKAAPAALPIELAFLTLDRVWLDVLLKQNVDVARGDALALFDTLFEATKGLPPEKVELTQAVLASRCAATLLHLLAVETKSVKEVPEETGADVAKRFADGLAAGHPLLDWRALEWARLVVLDRGAELAQRLAEWYANGDDFTKLRYGRDLAHLRAERNQLDEAAALFEAITKIDPLPHADWMTLASWYTALGKKDDAARARLSAWVALDENQLGNLLNQARWKTQAHGEGNGTVVDDDVPDQLVALMRKAQWPANWAWQLQNLYAATKDFRLLQCLPEAVLGHTAQGIYPFLQNVAGFDKLVDEEATVDRILAHLATVAPRAKTATDRRALALLQFIAQYKAAAQKNGGGPHAEAALAALKAAFARDWADGEARLYAALLQSFGAFNDLTLRSEQLRQVRELSARAPAGSADRLAIVDSLAYLLWNATDRDASLQVLGAELSAQRAANGGRLPDRANDPLSHYVSYLQLADEWMTAERAWSDELKVALNDARTSWLEIQLYQTYAAAVRGNGATTLGKGRALYAAAQKLVLQKLAVRSNEGRAQQLMQSLISLWSSAKAVAFPTVSADVTRFAFEGLPATLSLYQYRGGQQMVSQLANSVHEFAGAATAVDFLVTRAENEPHWLVRVGQSFWEQGGWMVANWRHEAGKMDERVESRLLNLVLKELKSDLQFGAQRGRGIYDIRWNTFWGEKRRDFSNAAHELLPEITSETGDDESAVMRVAEYLHDGLQQYDDAITVLLDQKKRGRLANDPQAVLVEWLQKRERWAESLPLAAEMVEKRPDNLQDRIRHLLSLARCNRRPELETALSATVAHWQEKKLWNEEVIAALAQSCLETTLPEKAVTWFNEAVALHVKSAPNRGIGDGVLSIYYGKLAAALADLGRTQEAVDAAAGAVIAWGNNQNNRNVALAALQNVLLRSEDLDGYVALLDAEVRKSGLENPTIRRALGAVYMQKSAWAKAAAQFKASLEVQPNDAETQRALVTAYDKMKRPDLAVAQLYAALEVTGHDVALTRELGERLVKLRDAARAERVYTNLVETMAQESESHEALAKIREGQERLPDAAEQWEQVVRIRSKEPTGYLGLARVLIREKQKKEAVEVIQKLLGGEWESRFGDVKAEARSLLKQVEGRSF